MATLTAMAQDVTWSPTKSHFSLWHDKATEVRVNIYNQGLGGTPEKVVSLDCNSETKNWTADVRGDLRGKFYTFQVKLAGEWRPESAGIDAHAVGVNGQRGAIIDMRSTDPNGWNLDCSPVFSGISDAIIYEMHHRDFSIDETSGIKNRGKFLALTEEGTKTAEGFATGIDHLKELGVTHVHLLPSYDFGSIDELTGNALGGGGRIPSTYNWGYDPVNYNVPEGSYSTDAKDPVARIREFKQMVMALHKAGIRVVMDVVYNHVFDHDQSAFQKLYPGEFFRYKADGTPANGSGCGNETASDKELMRKYMIESVRYWMTEYHVDGFRFDLMGIHDIETMNLIREAAQKIDPNVIIYGEGWAAEAPAYDADKLAMKANASRLGGIAAFGDELRDGLRGGWSNDKEGAFLIGKSGNEESVKFGIAGAVPHSGVDMSKVNYSKEAWATSPSQMISYVSCHDDMCIADRIMATAPKADKAERKRLQKLAYATVMTSRGVPFIWCGDEIMRDRKGVHNCYTSPDSINAIPWSLKSENEDVFRYVSNYIALRKQIQPQYADIEFLPVKGSNLIATRYTTATTSYIVILNSRCKAATVSLPQGTWSLLVDADGNTPSDTEITYRKQIRVPAQSAIVIKAK